MTIWDPQNADSYRYLDSPTGFVINADASVVQGNRVASGVFDGTEGSRTRTFTIGTYETRDAFRLQVAVATPTIYMDDTADDMGSKPRPVCTIAWDGVTATDSNVDPRQGWISDGQGGYRDVSTCTLNTSPMTYDEMRTF
ncbi:hypothetical protein AB0383_19745 [Amycolatopsis sp. NPDC051373]|uniref:hypothetical protein n=1 Tax=Amycolatopsis sp. NPDC051373 TaxID=3155801 RepID=UPI00344DAE0F